MRPTIMLALLSLGSFVLSGCSHTPKANPYYVAISHLESHDLTETKWLSHPYHGYCDEHGLLTNSSTDRTAVTKWVDAHNDHYHRDGNSIYWAKVYRDPDGD